MSPEAGIVSTDAIFVKRRLNQRHVTCGRRNVLKFMHEIDMQNRLA